jgi:hypothetical protein
MAITVYENSIVIGGTTISNTPTGIRIDGGSSSTLKGFSAAVIRNESSGNMLGATYSFITGNIPGPTQPTVMRYAFASQVTTTDVGTMSQYSAAGAPASSTTSGYTHAGGYQAKYTNKFPFAVTGFTSTNWIGLSPGNMLGTYLSTGSLQSATNGYIGPRRQSGGEPYSYVNTILKYPFATDNWTAAQTGTGATAKGLAQNHSSTINGYISGGFAGPLNSSAGSTTIEKFWFSSDSDSKSIGNLMIDGAGTEASISSNLNGYIAYNSQSPQPAVSYIQRFPFVVDSNTTDVGNLIQARQLAAGTGSRDGYGFITSGIVSPYTGGARTSVERFAFANETLIALAGDIPSARFRCNAHQV